MKAMMTNFEWWVKEEMLLKSKTPKQMMIRLRSKLHFRKDDIVGLLDDCSVATTEELKSMSWLEICTKYHDEIAEVVAEELSNAQ